MRETLINAMKDSMRAKESKKLTVIRMINARIKNADINARSKWNQDGIGETEIVAILQNMVKQRTESAKMYIEGNRPELAEVENNEIAIKKSFYLK